MKSNIDWIFENGPKVLKSAHGASIKTLAKCIGINNLWGANGEGYVYYQNSFMVLGMAGPFLKNKDKQGFLDLIKSKQGDVNHEHGRI